MPSSVGRLLTTLEPLPIQSTDSSSATRSLQIHVLAALAEGLGPDVAVADILRFVDDERTVRRALGQLAEDGHLETLGGGQARFDTA